REARIEGAVPRMARLFFSDMLRCADGPYYVGHTDDLERRLAQHQNGGRCRYTTSRRPVRLVWSEAVSTRGGARAGGGPVKRWGRAKKEALARGDVERFQSLARKSFVRRPAE